MYLIVFLYKINTSVKSVMFEKCLRYLKCPLFHHILHCIVLETLPWSICWLHLKLYWLLLSVLKVYLFNQVFQINLICDLTKQGGKN